MRSLTRFSHMITSSFESTFWISGGSASSGNSSRMPATRSRMSLAAASTSRSTSNSTVIRERPSSLRDSMNRMPSTPAIRSSTISVIRVSTTFAAAPGYDVSMETIGGSMSGYSRNGRRSKATSPKAINSKLMTEAKTGRLTDRSDRTIVSPRPASPTDPGAVPRLLPPT